MGTPASRMISRVTSLSAQRTATVETPPVPGGQHHGQRPGPEFFCQRIGTLRHVMAEQVDLLRTGHMEDQRVVLGATLGNENLCHGLLIQAVSTQAVDCLRGNGNQPTLSDQLGSNPRSLGVCGR